MRYAVRVWQPMYVQWEYIVEASSEEEAIAFVRSDNMIVDGPEQVNSYADEGNEWDGDVEVEEVE